MYNEICYKFKLDERRTAHLCIRSMGNLNFDKEQLMSIFCSGQYMQPCEQCFLHRTLSYEREKPISLPFVHVA